MALKNAIDRGLRKLSSARLNKNNHCLVYPVTIDAKSKAMQIDGGWRLVGWTDAPYGKSKTAVVFEKQSPAAYSIHDVLSDLEPGLYWCHGDESTFLSVADEQSATREGEP